MTNPATVTPAQWSALQRGEEVEILERMEPQPEWEEEPRQCPDNPQSWIGRYRVAIYDSGGLVDSGEETCERICPHAIGDKLAVVCPECEGRGWEYCDDAHDVPTRLICDCNPGDDIEYQMPQVTIHSITARQVDDVWHRVLSVQLEDA